MTIQLNETKMIPCGKCCIMVHYHKTMYDNLYKLSFSQRYFDTQNLPQTLTYEWSESVEIEEETFNYILGHVKKTFKNYLNGKR